MALGRVILLGKHSPFNEEKSDTFRNDSGLRLFLE